jgi:hypothetical protein
MKKLRRIFAFALLLTAVGSATACSDITGYDEDCTGIPGSNNRCDE